MDNSGCTRGTRCRRKRLTLIARLGQQRHVDHQVNGDGKNVTGIGTCGTSRGPPGDGTPEGFAYLGHLADGTIALQGTNWWATPGSERAEQTSSAPHGNGSAAYGSPTTPIPRRAGRRS